MSTFLQVLLGIPLGLFPALITGAIMHHNTWKHEGHKFHLFPKGFC
jgi:hypothetical protein